MLLRKIIYLINIILLIVNLIFLGILFSFKEDVLKIVFMDVGQGDAILISEGENQVLIDGGKSEAVLLERLNQYMPFWDRKIEVVLATHPDQDHIGGLSELPQRYEIGSLISTKAKNNSQVFEVFQENYSKNEISKIEGKIGTKIKFSSGEFEILFPFESLEAKVYKDTNATSILGKLTYGGDSFLLTGDITETEEKKLLESQLDVRANYLKIAHHGSKYASSTDFLKSVDPFWGIISVGSNNRFGHPAEETLKRLSEENIEILRTDESGDIVFECKKEESCQRKIF